MRGVQELALSVLMTSDPLEKVQAARAAAHIWRDAPRLTVGDDDFGELPNRPARPDKPELAHPNEVPRRRLGSLDGRIALIHSLAHIELNAIDLAFDMAVRFSSECETRFGDGAAFVSDWITVGAEEAEHFEMLENRLNQLGSQYGALKAHDGLWEAAMDTRENWAARLAVVPMVLEARGLDVTPATVEGLRAQKDVETAEILGKIYHDEIGHVAIGIKWFTRICDADDVKADEAFKSLVKTFFKGRVKPPFNVEARSKAGFLPNFYRSGI